MATPTKFCMGGVPRTGTGLIPASYRRQMESMCSTKEWTDLPKQPPPIKYPYRGDYVNERNQKIRGVKKSPKKPPQKSSARQKPKNIKSTNATNNDGPQWDTFSQHISSTKLSTDEQNAKIENRDKMVAFMRSEASKRQQKVALEKKLQEEMGTQKDKLTPVENPKPPRKPHVPRLSHFGRTGKRTKSEMKKLEASKGNKDATKENTSDPTQPKGRSYLDFISRKVEKAKKPTRGTYENYSNTENTNASVRTRSVTEKRIVMPKVPEQRIEQTTESQNEVLAITENQTVTNLDDSDEDRFRMQIERIVHRAAAIVLDRTDSESTLKELLHSSALAESTTFSWRVESESSKYVSKNTALSTEHETQSNSDTQQTSQQSEWFDAQISPGNTLIREVKKALEPTDESYCNDIELQSSSAFSSSSSQISEITFLPPEKGPSNKVHGKKMFRVLDGIEEDTNDSSTEIVPRIQIEPMQIPSNWKVNTNQTSQQTTNDSFSWSVSFTNECESQQLDNSLATESYQTPAQPDKIIEEQPLQPCIQPSALPSQHVVWEDEPLPRGYEFHLQKKEYEMADEIFSLLD